MRNNNTIYLIGRIREKVNDFIVQELKKLGITGIVPSHGDILAILFQHQELTMTEIATKIHRDRSTVTTLVNKLLRLGYVAAKKNPTDNRSVIIYLTKAGKKLEPGFNEISQKITQIEYNGVSEEEKQVLQKVLEKINHNFS